MSFDAGNKLNAQNFFHYYVFHAFADELSEKDRTKALIGTILLGLSFGIGHAICGLIYNKKYQFKKAPPDKQEVHKTKKIAQDQGVVNQQSGTDYTAVDKGIKPQPPTSDISENNGKKIQPPAVGQKQAKESAGGKKIASAPEARKPLTREGFPYIIDRPNKTAVDPKDLAPIGNIKLSSDHPLCKTELLFHAGAREAKKYPSWGLHQRVYYLENLSLKDYPTTDAGSLANDFYNQPTQVPNPEQILKEADLRILARIEKFNEEPIAFQKRLDLLGAKEHLKFIKLSDLEMPWNDSVFKIALMSDQEIKAIKLSDLPNLNERQKDILIFRVQELSLEPKVEDSEKPWQELTIGEFINLPATAYQLNANNLDLIDAELFGLIPDRLLDELDFTQCASNKLSALFRYKDSDKKEAKRRVALLSNEKIINNRDWFNDSTIELISEKHIKDGLDFQKFKLDQMKFDALFPKVRDLENPHDLERSLITILNAQQIYDLSPLMDENRAACIPFEMVKKLNLSTLIDRNSKEKNEELFRGLFPEDPKTTSKFKTLSLETIYKFYVFLDGETLRKLPKEKLGTWDFAVHKISEKQFLGLFVESMSWNDIAFKESRIRDLEIAQLLELERQGLMDKSRARCMTTEQMREMDLKDKEQFEFAKKYLFDVNDALFLGDAAKARLKALSKDNLNAVICDLVIEQLDEISPSQFKEIDFKAISGKFDFSMFFPRDNFHPYEINIKFHPRIHGLSQEELAQVLAGISDEKLKKDIQKIWDNKPKPA